MRGHVRHMDKRGWGWRQWLVQILIVIAVGAGMTPIILTAR
ncbi:hypothetical protein GCM10010331_69030 [Streptomyces xanthochromogenes]|nr:hypothetical protein GCM10010331_69030 [Streptomyces xanthochromogenes]